MNEDEWSEVERIVDKRLERNTEKFLIRWKGYGPSGDTWQTESDCIPSCYDLVVKLEKSRFKQNQREWRRSEIIGWKRDSSNQIKLLVEWKNEAKIEFYYSSVIQRYDRRMLIEYYEKHIPEPELDQELAHLHDSLIKTTDFDESDKPEKIIAFALSNGVKLYLISWMNKDEGSLVDKDFLESKCPELLIKFYEEHLLPSDNLLIVMDEMKIF